MLLFVSTKAGLLFALLLCSLIQRKGSCIYGYSKVDGKYLSLMFRFMSKEHVPNSLTIQGLGLSAFTA